jgi:hypothetical protein
VARTHNGVIGLATAPCLGEALLRSLDNGRRPDDARVLRSSPNLGRRQLGMPLCDLCDDDDAFHYCKECNYHFCSLVSLGRRVGTLQCVD